MDIVDRELENNENQYKDIVNHKFEIESIGFINIDDQINYQFLFKGQHGFHFKITDTYSGINDYRQQIINELSDLELP